MIGEFVKAFEANKDRMRRNFRDSFPGSYEQIVEEVFRAVNNYESDGYGCPDPETIHAIDDGDYQGTLVYIVPEKEYQPHEYWYVRVWYGSCCVCDSLQAIGYWDGEPTEQQLDDVMLLALHVVQGIRKMGGDES